MAEGISCLKPGLDWTRLFMSLTAGAGTRCMSLLRDSPTLTHRPLENISLGWKMHHQDNESKREDRINNASNDNLMFGIYFPDEIEFPRKQE
jgi:hypothetical protein